MPSSCGYRTSNWIVCITLEASAPSLHYGGLRLSLLKYILLVWRVDCSVAYFAYLTFQWVFLVFEMYVMTCALKIHKIELSSMFGRNLCQFHTDRQTSQNII